MKKRDGIPQIQLEETEDILKTVSSQPVGKMRPKIVVGFAAESRDLLQNAREKLTSKKVDMVVANDISASDAGFGVDTNRITLLFPDGRQEPMPLMSKTEAAEAVLEKISTMLE
jgi:phosphopantothenoylcysteine decarboxylase/phosphopantothenate--cysteine ligase